MPVKLPVHVRDAEVGYSHTISLLEVNVEEEDV